MRPILAGCIVILLAGVAPSYAAGGDDAKAARDTLSRTWSRADRTRALRVLVDATRPRLVPCAPQVEAAHQIDCPIQEGDPERWFAYRMLFMAETGDPPEGPGTLATATLAAAKFAGWTMPGALSSELCALERDNRPVVEPPPDGRSGHCGEHGYRICLVRPRSTWIHVAGTPCEGDTLLKTEYADQNGDGVDEALIWIRYDSYDGADVVGTRTNLYIVDGRTGSILLAGLIAATVSDPPDKGELRLNLRRIAPGRLTLTARPTSPSIEARLRKDYPLLLAPGTYVLGRFGFHRADAAANVTRPGRARP
jgi:hypothetical protein